MMLFSVPPTPPLLQTPVSVYNDTVYNINCTGRGYPEPTVTLLVNYDVLTGSDTTNCTGGVCAKTRTASLDGSNYTPGQSIRIACSVTINQPPFTCTIAQNSSLQAQCYTAVKTSSQARTVPVVGKTCNHGCSISCQYLLSKALLKQLGLCDKFYVNGEGGHS